MMEELIRKDAVWIQLLGYLSYPSGVWSHTEFGIVSSIIYKSVAIVQLQDKDLVKS